MRVTNPPASLLIVDGNATSADLVQSLASKMGVIEVSIAASLDSAWPKLASRSWGFVVTEWTLGERSAVPLLNRLRAHPQYALTPVLVTTAADADLQADIRLLDDFPCMRLANKPLTAARFGRDVDELMAENKWYQQNRARISSLFVDPARAAGSADRALAELTEKAPNPLPLLLCAGEALLDAHQLTAAEAAFRRALGVDGRALRALNGLGRSLFLAGRPTEAAGYLRIARRECPANVHRLCMLGEIELGEMRVDDARRRFEEALAVDEQERRAVAGLALCKNVEDHIRKHSGAGLPKDFARLCNAIGVALVHDGEIERGIDQYQAALQLLRDDLMVARVKFNVGLAFMKWNRVGEARVWFSEADQLAGGKFPRARAMLQRLDMDAYPATQAAVAKAVVGGDLGVDDVDITVFEEERF